MKTGLALLVVLSFFAYRTMIDLKPVIARPAPDLRHQTELAELQARLTEHVQVLGGEIGERHLGRPQALQAASQHIRDVWTRQDSCSPTPHRSGTLTITGRTISRIRSSRRSSPAPPTASWLPFAD